MKRFLVRLLFFAFLILLIDKLAGTATSYLTENAICGDTQKTEYICDHSDEDILIFGSSRAVRHYDPRIFEDSLGMTCYNCGYNGCGIITAYGLLSVAIHRYEPKLVIYDVCSNFEYLKIEKDNTRYLGQLKPYYERDGIDSLFYMIDPSERVKMKSRLYRLNSKFFQMLSENLLKRNENIKGFKPINKTMKYEPMIEEKHIDCVYDPVKLKCLNDFVDLCVQHNIKLVFMVSPSYLTTKNDTYTYIEEFSQEKGISYINHLCDSSFNRNKDLFSDKSHMNKYGAECYTKTIVGEIKKIIEN